MHTLSSVERLRIIQALIQSGDTPEGIDFNPLMAPESAVLVTANALSQGRTLLDKYGNLRDLTEMERARVAINQLREFVVAQRANYTIESTLVTTLLEERHAARVVAEADMGITEEIADTTP